MSICPGTGESCLMAQSEIRPLLALTRAPPTRSMKRQMSAESSFPGCSGREAAGRRSATGCRKPLARKARDISGPYEYDQGRDTFPAPVAQSTERPEYDLPQACRWKPAMRFARVRIQDALAERPCVIQASFLYAALRSPRCRFPDPPIVG